jgi:hypothetical protein
MGSPLPASAPGINGLAPAHICAGTEWARSRHVDTGTKWARHRRICAETGLTPPTPTPGTDWARHAHVVRLALRLPRPHSHQDRAHHSPRLRRDRACPAHICTGTDGLCRSARPPSRRSSRTPASRPSRSCHRMCACGLSSRACARRSACVCMCACVCALASASLYLHACTLRRARASVRACACGSAAGSHRAEGPKDIATAFAAAVRSAAQRWEIVLFRPSAVGGGGGGRQPRQGRGGAEGQRPLRPKPAPACWHRAGVRVRGWRVCGCARTHTHTRTHANTHRHRHANGQTRDAHTRAHTLTQTHAHMHTHIHTHTHAHTHTNPRAHTHTHTRTLCARLRLQTVVRERAQLDSLRGNAYAHQRVRSFVHAQRPQW